MPLWIFVLLLGMSLNKQRNTPVYDYHASVFADGAGYYAHLMNFWEADAIANMSISEEAKNGKGFTINRNLDLLETKYPMGVAMLLSPFYLIGKAFNLGFGWNEYVFSKYYSNWMCVGACFYLALALYFLQRTIRLREHSWLVATITPLLLLFVTNLLYYVTDKNCFSHLYSFFSFSGIIYFTQRAKHGAFARNINIAIVFGAFAVLCRLTNIVMLLPIVFTVYSGESVGKRFISFAKSIPSLLPGIMVASLFLFVQLDYWKAISDSYFHYSYGDEGFTNWNKPPLLFFFFTTNNGWLTYTPFMVATIAALFISVRKKVEDSTLYALILLLGIYIQASWWCPNFGCSYGMRPMVDFYPLFAIPLAGLLSRMIDSKSKIRLVGFTVFTLVCLYMNFDIIYYYDGCFYGSDWDWNEYLKLYK